MVFVCVSGFFMLRTFAFVMLESGRGRQVKHRGGDACWVLCGQWPPEEPLRAACLGRVLARLGALGTEFPPAFLISSVSVIVPILQLRK